MNKLLPVGGLALLLATFFSLTARPVPIEHKLIRIHASEVLAGFPAIEQEPVEIQALLLDMADDPLLLLKAQAAFLRYPQMSRRLFPLYAAEPEFQQILRRYGENILPPIDYFVSNRVSTLEWMNTAAAQLQAAKRLFADTPGEPASGDPGRVARSGLSPDERGWYAVHFIHTEGYNFIGQFAVDDQGNTLWLGTERVLEGLNQFFASGIRDLEIKHRFGEELTAGDLGRASLDALVFASAVKLLRIGRTATVTTQSASRGARAAAYTARVTRSSRLLLNGSRYAKWPVLVGAGYLVVTHPGIINDLLTGVAGALGYPAPVVRLVGWVLVLMPALCIGRWLLWLLVPLLTGVFRVTTQLLALLAGRQRRRVDYDPR
ncbi:hypothetical protein [Marinobacter sp. X15-166B]|uniref:hypothetical protein n=1 Tax=Marinobacter sp. X15-166B TaxID=1897620 RepID=UPI00085CB0D6|nr:hypothetical protein [Marinobacter sp. X15-166B]OEY65403.1 hypothetical protein BG841_02320 [Marinobacter sp. X15-166B]